MTSGVFGNLYVVNTDYYNVSDDKTCFKLSKAYNSLPKDCYISDYEVKYGIITHVDENRYYIIWGDKDESYKTSEFRVYKINGYTEEISNVFKLLP